MKLLLINDTTAHCNWGAQATPHAICELLRALDPNIEVSKAPHAWLRHQYRTTALPLRRVVTYRVGSIPHVNPLVVRLSRATDFFPSVSDDFEWFLEEWKAGRGGPPADHYLPRAEEADCIVYNGENSNYRNTVEACRASFLLWVAKRLLGKPSCAINLTAHLTGVRPILRGMLQRVYPILDLVATREPRSQDNLLECGISNAISSADVVFGLDPNQYDRGGFNRWRESVGLRQPYFCLSASGLPASTPKATWDGEVARLVRRLKRIVPNAVLVAKDGPNLFMRDVAARTGSLFFGPEHTFPELWPLFENAEFLVTGHFHYAIFAAMTGCPFVPLSANNHKMEGLCEQLNWHQVEPFDVTALSICGDKLSCFAKSLLTNRDELSAGLLKRSQDLRAEARHLLQRVITLAGGLSTGPDDRPTPTIDVALPRDHGLE